MTESVKAFEIRVSVLFNLGHVNNTVLSCFFFFNYYLYLLITIAIAQIYNPIVELVIPIRIPSNEAKVETEIHPVIIEAKIRKCLV